MTTATSTKIYRATGRRKSAVARVRIEDGGKDIVINERTFENFFPQPVLRMIVQQPFELTQMTARFGVKADVYGGGLSGQAGAVRLGIARALVSFDPALKAALRKGGFLTRDPREKERKKFGRKGARRSFQYTKR